jgi:uncharacterized protein YutE (UPF0331/DUF86 family)
MGELLLRKILLSRERIEKIRRALPSSPEQVLEDDRTEAFLAFHLFLLIQDCVDVAAHLIAERGLAIPASHREAFETLVRAGLISDGSGRAMAQMASLRNRIAHTYGDLDPVRMTRELPAGLGAATRFLDELVRSTEKTDTNP